MDEALYSGIKIPKKEKNEKNKKIGRTDKAAEAEGD
jgi:hypothetical protein